jgi:hypothetical protein
MKTSIGLLISGTTLVTGIVIGKTIEKRKHDIHVGSLRLDNSEADEPIKMFLELEVPLDSLEKMSTVVFKVVKENYISHK